MNLAGGPVDPVGQHCRLLRDPPSALREVGVGVLVDLIRLGTLLLKQFDGPVDCAHLSRSFRRTSLRSSSVIAVSNRWRIGAWSSSNLASSHLSSGGTGASPCHALSISMR